MKMEETKGMKLVSKKTQWVPGKGVRTTISVSTSIPYFSGLGKMLTMKYNHQVCITGEDKAIVSLKVGGPSSEKDKWEAAIYDWLATTDYMAEWEKEAANYMYVISQVDLPADAGAWPWHSVYKSFRLDTESCGLTYRLMLGKEDMHLSVIVLAKYDEAMAYVGMVEDNSYEEDSMSYVGISEHSLNYPVTVDSVRGVIGPAIDVFVGKLQGLAGMDVVEVDKY